MAPEPVLPVGFRKLVRRFRDLAARRGILRLKDVPAVCGRAMVLLPVNNDNGWPDRPIFNGGQGRAIPPLVGRRDGRLAFPRIDLPPIRRPHLDRNLASSPEVAPRGRSAAILDLLRRHRAQGQVEAGSSRDQAPEV